MGFFGGKFYIIQKRIIYYYCINCTNFWWVFPALNHLSNSTNDRHSNFSSLRTLAKNYQHVFCVRSPQRPFCKEQSAYPRC
jgi:hypothetical protein